MARRIRFTSDRTKAGIGCARRPAVFALQLPSPEPMPFRSRLHEAGHVRHGRGARTEDSRGGKAEIVCSAAFVSNATEDPLRTAPLQRHTRCNRPATKAISAGLLAGFVAAVVLTTAMLLLATLGVATPLVIIGDRLSVFIPPGPFLSLMGKVGGYNHLKQLGVGSTIAGQLVVGAIGGAIFGWFARRNPARIPASLDDVDLRPAAGRCICDRTVAGVGHELHRPAYSGRPARHTHWLRTVRSFVRTNASNWLPISDHGKDGQGGL